MATKVLGIDLHDAGRDGVYRVDPDDPATLVADAARAGLPVVRIDLAGCVTLADLLTRIVSATGLAAEAADGWDQMDFALRHFDEVVAPGHVMLFDHVDDLSKAAPAMVAELRQHLASVAADWHRRGVPFFVFLEFQDHETRDAAIDA